MRAVEFIILGVVLFIFDMFIILGIDVDPNHTIRVFMAFIVPAALYLVVIISSWRHQTLKFYHVGLRAGINERRIIEE